MVDKRQILQETLLRTAWTEEWTTVQRVHTDAGERYGGVVMRRRRAEGMQEGEGKLKDTRHTGWPIPPSPRRSAVSPARFTASFGFSAESALTRPLL